MTPFSALINLAGLSLREASNVLSVSLATVTSWSSGRRTCPAGVIEEIKLLIKKQDRSATEALDHIARLSTEHGPPDGVDLGYPTDDYEAQTLGWPCVGAWRGMAARVIAASRTPVRLVPRGSTLATAAAAGAHENAKKPRQP